MKNSTILLVLLACVVVFFVLWWIAETLKAMKDPDVQEASALRMSITRFRKYKQLHDELMALYEKYGTESPEAREKFMEIMKYAGRNPNEWRRFSEYMYQKSRERFFNHEWDDEDTLER